MFERLQLFIKCLQLFSKLSAKRWSLACLVLCLAITVPVVLSQQPATHRAFIGNSTQPIEFYSVEKSEHFEHTLFTVVFYLCVCLRDLVPHTQHCTLHETESLFEKETDPSCREQEPQQSDYQELQEV